MNGCVVDTHALFWYLTARPILDAGAKAIFLEGEQGRALLHIPSIVMAELYYLNDKFGRPLDFAREYTRLAEAGQFRLVDLRAEDVLHFEALASIPEMHDRIIAGVAYALNLPVLTRDQAIINSRLVQTVW